MPRFQSRLFNWIDTSLPAQIGRSVRRSLDQKIRQLSGLPLQELPRLLAYQVAKAALYPVYLLTSTTKRIFPSLDRSKIDPKEKLRSQPETTGLLPKSTNQELDQTTAQKVEPTNDLPKSEIPLFFRPLAKFLDWIDRTKTQLDRKISAIVKRPSENLSTTETSELEPKLIANRLFAEIWRQQIDQAQAEQNSLKENNGLSENVALGKNKRLEQLRRLIEAAIAYFFGNQTQPQDQSLESNEEVAEIFGTESPDAEALPDSPKLRRRRVTAAKSGRLKENAPLAETNNLDRLRDLIAAAIDYFIGKRSLDGNPDGNPNGISGTQPDLLTEKIIDKLQSRFGSYPNRDPNPESEFDDALKLDNQLERLQKLIEDAIAYFFNKQRSQPTLDETSDITPSAEAWLTMEDLFGDDNGPWPLPLEYESISFSKSPDRTAIHSSSELQNFETTTTQISQDQLESSLVFEEELQMYQSQSSDRDSDRPLRAWIETKANLWGYSNNPVMIFLLWIDAIVVKIENSIIKLWKGLISFPKRLIYFIRYGKSR
ncbi:hypothetical protein [Pseudanabaena sp. BC1403]|uniref:hypothetical protein n=1 Tax=Pseudanabaena sp. BC1403 TaxID=2043171 RepID=UPI0011AED6F9|nr:hypothetical protein [Pseudanabaena sp. BC1403]